MHILFISPYHISKYTGGQEQYTHNLASGLSKLSHRVSYLCSSSSSQSSDYQLVNIPGFNAFGHILPTPRWINTISKLNPDIIHLSNHTLPYIFLSSQIQKKLQIKIIFMYLAPSQPQNPLLKPITSFSEKLLMRYSNAVSTLTLSHTHSIRLKYPENQVFTLTPCLPQYYRRNTPAKHSINSIKTILFVSTLDSHHYYKGFNTLITALGNLTTPFRAVIVGGGDHQQKLTQQVASLPISSSVTFTGKVSSKQLIKYYRNSDVLVLPSSSPSEGFGIVLLESLSQGTPVITTTTAGASKLLEDKQFATIIPPNNPKILAQYINRQPIKKYPHKSAIIFSHSFSQEKLAQKTLSIYQNILDSS